MILRLLIASLFLLTGSTHAARAEGCNIADLLFGKVRVDLLRYSKQRQGRAMLAGYSIGIIFGDDFDSKRFAYDRILGRIDPPERDGSRRINDVNGNVCGVLASNMAIDTSEAECASCSKARVSLRPVPPSGYVVMSAGQIVGTVELTLSDRTRGGLGLGGDVFSG